MASGFPRALVVIGIASRLVIGVHGQTDNSQADSRDAEMFRSSLLQALANDNRNQVAALFRYPLQVRVLGLDSRLVYVKDAASMTEMYPLFFNAGMRCAVERHRVLATDDVVSLAGGRLIAERTNGGFRVTRMTVSLESPPRPRSPRHVGFSSERPRQFAGRLANDEMDTYVLIARAGQQLQARIERFPGKALGLRVIHAGTSRGIRGAATEYARSWAARLTEDAQYRVEVSRRASYCDPEVTYVLELSLR